MKLKQYEIVTDVEKLSVDLQATFMKYKTIKQWAYIIHDKDDTRAHYHIYINFGNSGVDSKDVASWFNIGENFINKVKGRKSDILLYLTHANDTQQYKHQYDPSCVHANFDFETEIQNAKILGHFDKFSYAQQLKYVDSLPTDEKAKSFNQLKKLWELECQCLTLNTDRHIEVIFICGKGGTGKTYYAKKLLKSLDYDYCITSSSNDPFQDYLGQKAIIMDDLRDTDFELSDLLKILDNNTGSSVKSRFNNKVFNGNMIIVTSSVPINFWYKQYKFNEHDSLYQLYRRFSSYVQITDETITVYKKLDKTGKPDGLGQVYKNELLEMKRQKTVEPFDIIGAFDKICKADDIPF